MGKLRNVDTGARDSTSAPGTMGLEPGRSALFNMFRQALLSRRLDEAQARLRKQGKVFFHISAAGHEIVQAAAAEVLRPGHDWFYLYYRDRCLNLGLGVPPVDLLLQAFGKQTDPMTGGRQMPSHFGTPELRIVNQSSATGSQFLHAVGTAEGIWLARQGGLQPRRDEADGVEAQRVERDEIVLTTGGDGATSEGEFYEAVSTACLRRLPVLFLIEDNAYAISVPVQYQTPGGNISRLFRAFPDLHVDEVDGLDPIESFCAIENAATYVREGRGPALVHAHVARLVPHSDADDDRLYRSSEELEKNQLRDPLLQFESLLLDEGHLSPGDLRDMTREVDLEVAQAVEIAEVGPDPDTKLVKHFLFAPETAVIEETKPAAGVPLTLIEGIRKTLEVEMERDERILLFGEDVADVSHPELLGKVRGKGGVFRATRGLQRKFGPERVFNTPIAEAAIVGRALGLAIRGFLPVAESQFFDYIWPAMHQLRNEVSVMRWRSFNNFSTPMVLRVPIGGYLRGGSIYHSQSGESIFCSCPGLRVVMPSNARDAAGLLRSALRSHDPVLFLEHKHLYRQKYASAPDPGPEYVIPLGCARTAREGSDLTVITYGALVEKSLRAADQVADDEGLDVEVIDLRSLQPYDWDAIRSAVERTNRVLVAAEEAKSHGFGAEIAARIAQELFAYIDAPISRVGALELPVAYAPSLEAVTLPQESDLVAAMIELARY